MSMGNLFAAHSSTFNWCHPSPVAGAGLNSCCFNLALHARNRAGEKLQSDAPFGVQRFPKLGFS